MIGHGGHLIRRKRGLGDSRVVYGSIVDVGAGIQLDCADETTFWWNPLSFFYCKCDTSEGSTCLAEWKKRAAGVIPSVPAPVSASAPQTTTQMTVPGQWTPEQAIAATSQAQKEQMSQFMAGVATGLPDLTVDCSNFWNYWTNSNCAVDCSRFPSSLLNASCGGGSNWLLPVAGLAVALLVLKR